ncbi:MAG TPA: acyl-CoA dehydrogenase family protein [Actinomycetota bacterium]|nr:acyl-CoA dehydrogenase family protein [Actinomycetota bacterium]
MEPFSLPEELELFRKAAREVCDERIAPRAAEIDATDEFPHDVHQVLVESELMAVGYPEEHGGAGGGSLSVAVLVEEVARASASVSLIPLVSRLGAIPVMLAGTKEQKDDLLGGISRGEHQMSYGLTEPGAGSDAISMQTRYERADSGFRLNGAKRFITNAGVSDRVTVFATRDPEERSKGISAFVVHDDDAGFSVGKSERKMGIRGSPTRELYFENVELPGDRLIGDEGQGFSHAMRTLDYSRPTIAAQALGIAQGAFEAAARYSREREQFGAPIGDLQGVQFLLADMAIQVEAARLLTYKAAAACDAQDPRLTYLASIAKTHASDTAMQVTTDAVQVLGGYGYMREYGVERMMRDAKITQLYEGTNQIQRVVIARQIAKALGG